jgi:hypothetical protein
MQITPTCGRRVEEARRKNTVSALMQIWNEMDRSVPFKIKPFTPEKLAYYHSEEAKCYEGLKVLRS